MTCGTKCCLWGFMGVYGGGVCNHPRQLTIRMIYGCRLFVYSLFTFVVSTHYRIIEILYLLYYIMCAIYLKPLFVHLLYGYCNHDKYILNLTIVIVEFIFIFKTYTSHY